MSVFVNVEVIRSTSNGITTIPCLLDGKAFPNNSNVASNFFFARFFVVWLFNLFKPSSLSARYGSHILELCNFAKFYIYINTMLSSHLLHRMVCLYVVLVLMLCECEGRLQLQVIKAVFMFGDSIVDQGNNNNLITLAKCNFSPYGKDFMGGKPTGRFSNAKTPADLIVEKLGIKELMPPYLDSNLNVEDLKTGVSFASGACGYDPLTSDMAKVISITGQLNYLQEYIGKMKGLIGVEEANYIMKNSLFQVVAGSDDLANTYFTVGARRKQYDINAYTDFMVAGASNFVQELYKMGARRIGVFGIPPIGCLPSQRTLHGGLSRVCVDEYNEAAQLTNTKLIAELDSLSKQFNQTKLVFMDIYTPVIDMIANPQKYGFEVVDKGCCGTGIIEVAFLCNTLCRTCEDDTKYLFWDSYHPTEKGYTILIDHIIKKYFNKFL